MDDSNAGNIRSKFNVYAPLLTQYLDKTQISQSNTFYIKQEALLGPQGKAKLDEAHVVLVGIGDLCMEIGTNQYFDLYKIVSSTN